MNIVKCFVCNEPALEMTCRTVEVSRVISIKPPITEKEKVPICFDCETKRKAIAKKKLLEMVCV